MDWRWRLPLPACFLTSPSLHSLPSIYVARTHSHRQTEHTYRTDTQSLMVMVMVMVMMMVAMKKSSSCSWSVFPLPLLSLLLPLSGPHILVHDLPFFCTAQALLLPNPHVKKNSSGAYEYGSSYIRLHHRYSHLHGSSRGGLPMSLHHRAVLRSHDSLHHHHHRALLLQRQNQQSSSSSASFPMGGHANPYSAG